MANYSSADTPTNSTETSDWVQIVKRKGLTEIRSVIAVIWQGFGTGLGRVIQPKNFFVSVSPR